MNALGTGSTFGVCIMNDSSCVLNLKRFSESLVGSFLNFKSQHDLDYDEVLIFVALGGLNFEPGGDGMMYVKPASTVALVSYLDMPRETLRRKMLLLEDRGLVLRNGSGYTVKNMQDWLGFEELLAGEPEPA